MSVGEANKRAQKVWYARNKQYAIDRQRNKRAAIRKWFREEILPKYVCIKCNNSHPACMDFHHRDPSTKLEEIGDMLRKKYSRENILKEVAKCDVMCANCHRIHHWEERQD